MVNSDNLEKEKNSDRKGITEDKIEKKLATISNSKLMLNANINFDNNPVFNEFSIKNRAEEESENKNEEENKSLKSILDENLNEKLVNAADNDYQHIENIKNDKLNDIDKNNENNEDCNIDPWKHFRHFFHWLDPVSGELPHVSTL